MTSQAGEALEPGIPQAVGLVTDVGFFLERLESELRRGA